MEEPLEFFFSWGGAVDKVRGQAGRIEASMPQLSWPLSSRLQLSWFQFLWPVGRFQVLVFAFVMPAGG